MSTQSNLALQVSAGSQIKCELPYYTTPSRTLFSALGVLVGSGVVVLAFGATEAHAKSALDDMAWAPQPGQSAQSDAAANNSSMMAAASLARAMVPGAQTPVVSATAASPASVQAEQRAPQAVEQASQPVVVPVSRPALTTQLPSGGFAGMFGNVGVPSVQQQSASSVASSAPAAPALYVAPHSEPVAKSAPIGMAASPVRMAYSAPATATAAPSTRTPNVLGDLQSLRGSLATGIPAKADTTQPSAGQSTLDSQSTVAASKYELAATRRLKQSAARHTAGANDSAYSDWLGDGTSSRAVTDTTVVPEQAVRAARRSSRHAMTGTQRNSMSTR